MEHNHEVNIHIDKKTYKSPNPTTGSALYVLGKVPADYDLWEETSGPGDDKLIPNNSTIVHLKEGQRFYTAKRHLNPGYGK